ncbi:recombinase family protein [Tardiphaga sp. 42S5]|uniref:recombinase family protein n=1 Tax=Tardiphaga sp. 42S5 TaxID=1404799 RepID=UPI002A59A47D|nr:recombinase family protein [Tardiphaga sp. 42S5]WPO43754.1 recombinase family protein [Tardiphaga sp. 42S5]
MPYFPLPQAQPLLLRGRPGGGQDHYVAADGRSLCECGIPRCRHRHRVADHPYDVIIFCALNRFFRNVAEMELAIRKLHKHGVEVVSVTQPTGDDPSQILVHQIIGAFDEHASREISKNAKRSMLESARQGGMAQCLHSATRSSRQSGAGQKSFGSNSK